MYYFCTYFDSHYLPKGLALYRSLAHHCDSFKLWILCFDDPTYEVLSRMKLPGVHLIPLKEFEQSNNELLKVKAGRSLVEYYWTCTPFLLLHILRHQRETDVITYLDADLFFFGDPRPIYEELGNHSILIIKHRFGPDLMHLTEGFGIYNVGLLSFRNNTPGLRCLRWWRDRCLEWCFNRVEDDRFADQKYLDDWPTRFLDVVVLQHEGAGLAPWNVYQYRVHRVNGSVMVNSKPLVFYHFHGFHMINKWIYEPLEWCYHYAISREVKKLIYAPYVREVQQIAQELNKRYPKSYRSCRKKYGNRILIRLFRERRFMFALGSIVVQ